MTKDAWGLAYDPKTNENVSGCLHVCVCVLCVSGCFVDC